MGFRVALCTKDGTSIDVHFGQTRKFLIADVDEGGHVALVEWRDAPPRAEGGGHCTPWFDNVAKLLEDVDYVWTAKIGPKPHRVLKAAGITPLETPEDIAETAQAVARYHAGALHARPNRS